MPNSNLKGFHCPGRIPQTNEKCRAALCQTNGQAIYFHTKESFLGLAEAPPIKLQCKRYSYVNIWRQTNG